MATTTPNFGWPVPTSTDLVKDGATAMEALGDAIDTSMVDLKGGTTGQILSKASSADMDFSWTTPNPGDITGVTAGTGISGGGTSGDVTITNSMATTITTKGDLVPGTGSGTFARLAAGSNGETLVADSSTATGLRYQANFAAGKNEVINGDFGIWQRGTSFTTGTGYQYTVDRFQQFNYGTNTASCTQQTFTAGAAPVAGYEGQFFARFNSSSTATFFSYRIEDVRTLAGQTATFSFWAKSNSSQTITSTVSQNFGSGGSATVAGVISGSPALTTSWQRFSYTAAIPSISGKTIGTSSYVLIEWVGAANNAIDIWGVQLEAGSVATAFQTATGTIQGELAACQRYYYRQGGDNLYMQMGTGSGYSAANVYFWVRPPVTMRVTPTAIDYSSLAAYDNVTVVTATAAGLDGSLSSKNALMVYTTHSSGITQFRPYTLVTNNSTSGYLGLSAEL